MCQLCFQSAVGKSFGENGKASHGPIPHCKATQMIIHNLFSCIPLQISPGVIPSLGLCICKRCILKTEDREKWVSLVAFQAVWWEEGGPTLTWCVLGGCCCMAPRMCYVAGCLHCRQVKEGTLNWVWVLVWSLYCVALGKSSPLSWPQFLPLYNEVALPALTFWNLLKPIMSCLCVWVWEGIFLQFLVFVLGTNPECVNQFSFEWKPQKLSSVWVKQGDLLA